MLNKIISLFLVPLLLLSACGNGEASKDEEDVSSTNKIEENETVEVDKGILNVEITLPASFFEGEDLDQVMADAKADGVSEVIANEDGSLTYKMSKSKHKKMMAELKTSLAEGIEEIKNDEEFVSIKDITHNNTFSEFTLLVDQEMYENSFDGFITIGFAMSGMYYQLFSGIDSDDYKVTVVIQDETSGEVFDTIVYPDAFEE